MKLTRGNPKDLKVIVFIVLLSAVFTGGLYQAIRVNEGHDAAMFKASFDGVLRDQYYCRCDHYVFLLENGSEINRCGLSDELKKTIIIGDRLVKIKDSNRCLLYSNDTVIELQFLEHNY